MARHKPDKDALLSALAAYVLEHGLNTASLRPMAAAVGTSDRMLIYHFGNKAGLIAELLEHMARDMALALDVALPERRYRSEAELISDVLATMRTPISRSYSRIWFDIVSRSGQGRDYPAHIGKTILMIYLNWLSKRHPAGEAGAPGALALVEGLLVMDTVGCSHIVDRIVSGMREPER